MARQAAAHRSTTTCESSTIWRISSSLLGSYDPTILVEDVRTRRSTCSPPSQLLERSTEVLPKVSSRTEVLGHVIIAADATSHRPCPWDPVRPRHSSPTLGQNPQPGNRDNSGNRARANSGDNRRRRRNSSGSRDRRDRRRGYDRSHSPPSAALDFERQNVLFLLGLIREDVLEDVSPTTRLDPDTLKELHDVRIPEVKSAI